MFALCISAFMSMSAVPVSATQCLSCSLYVELNLEYTGPAAYEWAGNLYGDLTGTIVIHGEPPTFTGAGSIEHFAESFTITTDDGTEIVGSEMGIFNLHTSKAVANGEITGVSGANAANWEWLVGSQVHLSGVVNLYVLCFVGEYSIMPSEA